jgi:hypothetical protein
MIRVAFVINYNPAAWLGGFNVIRNLICSINANKPKNIKIVIFINKDISLKHFKNLDVEIIRTDLFTNINFFIKLYRKIKIVLFGKSVFFDNFFLKHKINVVSHHIALGRNSQIKSFPWIPDFQELHYPNYFTFFQLILRRLNIYFLLLSASKVILSSIDSKSDLQRISKINKNKIFIHPFFFNNYPKKNIIVFKDLQKKFNLKKNYFLLPNQYRPHKNHLLVLNSILYLKRKYNISINIISSGYKYSDSPKSYFKKVMNYRNIYNLHKEYNYIGIVNDLELYSLIYHSKAIINPSLFEGWNTSVMQARSLFKLNILSNIKSHLEQKNEKSFFFRDNDHVSLAKIILKILNKKKITFSNLHLKKVNKNNFLNYGKMYINLVNSFF